jgi:hypothetical protein
MFSSLHDNVAYFGLWADETRSQEQARQALVVLADAIARCVDDDVRSEELDAVLDWVERRSVRRNPVDRFRSALEVEHPLERKAALTDAYVRIMRELGLYSGRL